MYRGYRAWKDGYVQTCTRRRVFRVTGRTAGAHGGTVRSAIGADLGNTVGTRARIHWWLSI